MPANPSVSCSNGTFTVTVTPASGTGRIWIYAYAGTTAPTEDSLNPLDASPWQKLAEGESYAPGSGDFVFSNLQAPSPNMGMSVFTWSLATKDACFSCVGSNFALPCGGSSSSGSSSGSGGLPPGSSSSS